MRIISPSLLSANFKNIEKEIRLLEEAGVDRIHLDVMDGHFVPNLTFGPMMIKTIRKITDLHLETHLMINNPSDSLDQYIQAGSDTIIIHLEASKNAQQDLSYIRQNNVLAGISINPDTNENRLMPLIHYFDYILIMSVFPGKSGQTFINETLQKMKNVVSKMNETNTTIAVDGGVNLNTIKNIYDTGIDITIVGSGLFKALDIRKRYNELLHA